MFSKKFVNAEEIQTTKDEAALDRLKKLKGLQKQFETPLATFAGPSIKAAPKIEPKKEDGKEGSDIDEEELMNMQVPSSSSDEEEGAEWAEKAVISSAPSAALLPEDKELNALIEGSTSSREKKSKTRGELQRNLNQIGLVKQQQATTDQLATLVEPGKHPKELNPYWKEGGSGLPQDKQEITEKQPVETKQPSSSSASTDVKWLKRALLRCEQLAEEEGRSLEEVVAERYGSLEELEKQIEDAERKIGTSTSSRDYYDKNSPSVSADRKGSKSSSKSFINPARESDRRGRDEPDRRARDEPDRRRKDRDRDDRRDEFDGGRRDEHDRRSDRRSYGDERYRSKDYERARHQPVSDQGEAEEEERQPARREQLPAPRPDNSNRSAAASLRAQLNFPSSRPKKESPREEPELPPHPPQRAQMVDKNKAAAAALRAQLFGGGPSTSLAAPARRDRDGESDEEEDTSNQEVVLRTSKRTGLTMPYMASSCATSDVAPGGRRKLETHTSSGARLRFLPGEDHLSVGDMVAMEKASDARQQNDLYMRSFSGKEKLSDDFDIDDAYVEKASKRKAIEKHEAGEKRRAVAEHKQTSKALAGCTLCLDRVVKHLVVAFGEKSYLAVPNEVSLVEDHCQIIPRDHVRSATLLEDDAWEEVQLFKKSVFRMFADLGQDVVFMETCMPSRSLGHTIIECFPLEGEPAELAPIFFKKALLESEGLWSDNKKVVDIKDNIRKTIPSAFSYFAVEFGINGQGFAHIIENEAKFPAYFGKEVIGGMIDCEPSLWRRPAKDSIESQLDKSCRLQRLYAKYNWTQQSDSSGTSSTTKQTTESSDS